MENNNGNLDVLLDLQWGDCGKGKIIDALTKYRYVVRFNGANNAGHSVHNEHGSFALNTIPSGVLREDVLNIIGNMVLVNPIDLVLEISRFGSDFPIYQRLAIAEGCSLILPVHVALDNISSKGKIGSTGKGVTPGYMQHISREGIFVRDYLRLSASDFSNLVNKITDDVVCITQSRFDEEAVNYVRESAFKNAEFIKSLEYLVSVVQTVPDPGMFLRKKLLLGEKVILEGAQGVMLGYIHGTYPFVTSSETTSAAAIAYLGLDTKFIGDVYGVFKAYCTRVGRGPFPTEYDSVLSDKWSVENKIGDTDVFAKNKINIPFSQLSDFDRGLRIQHLGREYGTTTGRLRRTGRLDLPALAYAICKSGANKLVMTKLDIFDAFDEIEVCDYYEYNGQIISCLEDVSILGDVGLKPHYVKFQGWMQDTTGYRTYLDLPLKLKDFVGYVEKHLQGIVGTPLEISAISTGPKREQLIWL